MSMNAMESRDPAAAGGARRRLRSAAVAAALGALLTGGCGHPGAGRAPAAGPAPAPAAVPAQPAAAPPAGRAEALVRANETPPEQPAPFAEAVGRAGAGLFTQADLTLGSEPREVVIDPLIDAGTGARTTGTEQMGADLEAGLRRTHPQWKLRPLTREALARKPLLLIGTLTPVNTRPAIDTAPDAYRIWLTMIDLRTGRVVAKKLDRATPASVNPEPLPFYRDSPTWHRDRTTAAYINSCQVNTRIGDPADPDYLSRLPAAAVLNEATMAYGAGRLPEARRLYTEAAALADPLDLRVLNGLYLTNWRLGQRDQAAATFGRIVEAGLESRRLPMKVLFQPGGTAFVNAADLASQYAVWMDALAARVGSAAACVRIVGHSSRTGLASANEALSRRRAEAVERLLVQKNRRLTSRLSSDGVGSREALIGIGTDDQRDALDRRVEFKVVECG